MVPKSTLPKCLVTAGATNLLGSYESGLVHGLKLVLTSTAASPFPFAEGTTSPYTYGLGEGHQQLIEATPSPFMVLSRFCIGVPPPLPDVNDPSADSVHKTYEKELTSPEREQLKLLITNDMWRMVGEPRGEIWDALSGTRLFKLELDDEGTGREKVDEGAIATNLESETISEAERITRFDVLNRMAQSSLSFGRGVFDRLRSCRYREGGPARRAHTTGGSRLRSRNIKPGKLHGNGAVVFSADGTKVAASTVCDNFTDATMSLDKAGLAPFEDTRRLVVRDVPVEAEESENDCISSNVGEAAAAGSVRGDETDSEETRPVQQPGSSSSWSLSGNQGPLKNAQRFPQFCKDGSKLFTTRYSGAVDNDIVVFDAKEGTLLQTWRPTREENDKDYRRLIRSPTDSTTTTTSTYYSSVSTRDLMIQLREISSVAYASFQIQEISEDGKRVAVVVSYERPVKQSKGCLRYGDDAMHTSVHYVVKVYEIGQEECVGSWAIPDEWMEEEKVRDTGRMDGGGEGKRYRKNGWRRRR